MGAGGCPARERPPAGAIDGAVGAARSNATYSRKLRDSSHCYGFLPTRAPAAIAQSAGDQGGSQARGRDVEAGARETPEHEAVGRVVEKDAALFAGRTEHVGVTLRQRFSSAAAR